MLRLILYKALFAEEFDANVWAATRWCVVVVVGGGDGLGCCSVSSETVNKTKLTKMWNKHLTV